MTALRSLLFNIAFFGWTAPLLILCLPLLILPAWASYGVGRVWTGLSLRLLRIFCSIDYRLEGLERLPGGPCIVASKHQSAWDVLIMPALRDHPIPVVKQELTWIPLFGWFLRRSGAVAVDRAGGAGALKRLVADAKRYVAAGHSLYIFPEGTRTAPGTRRPYHPGVAALYTQLGIPVVPVALNSGLFWRRRAFIKLPGTITLKVLEPIAPGLERHAFMTELEKRIEGETEKLVAGRRAE